jgi:hypothetical protein
MNTVEQLFEMLKDRSERSIHSQFQGLSGKAADGNPGEAGHSLRVDIIDR